MTENDLDIWGEPSEGPGKVKLRTRDRKAGSPKRYAQRVKAAEKHRKDAGYDEVWSQMIRLYSNQYAYDELSMYEDVVAPNMVFSTVNVIVPSVAINYPKITVTARRPEDEERAEIVESAANYYWRHFDTHDEFRASTKDTVILGHGWIKTTWAFQEETVELEGSEWREQLSAAIAQRDAAADRAAAQGLDLVFPTDKEIADGIDTTRWKSVRIILRVSVFRRSTCLLTRLRPV
jgi:hypothetical protein